MADLSNESASVGAGQTADKPDESAEKKEDESEEESEEEKADEEKSA